MRKIFTLFLILTGWQLFAQSTCTQTFTVSGDDDGPTVLTINASDLTCFGTNAVTSMKLTNAAGSLTSGFCAADGSSWYGFDLSIDGGNVITGCANDFNEVSITGFGSLTITSHDDDAYSDGITITIDVEVTFTPSSPPACTSLSAPTNGQTGVSSSQVSWPVAAGGPTGYKLNVGTTPGGTNVLNMFDVGNVLSHDLGALTAGTTYYVKVIPYNIIGNATGCSESSFTTCGAIVAPSATETFDTYLPNCWSEGEDGDLAAGPATLGTSGWGEDGFGNVGNTGAIRYNLYLATANDWVISPVFTIPATGYELKFDAAANQYASTNAPTTPWEADDVVQVLVSTSGMSNWTVLYTFNDTNVPSNIGTTRIIDLDAFAGQNIRIAFRTLEGVDDGGADIDFSIDNLQVRLTPSCAEPTGLVASGVTHNSVTVNWGATTGNYQYVLDNVATDPAGAGTTLSGETYNSSSLNPSTTYYLHVRTVCAGPAYSVWSTVSFTTLATPPANDDCSTATVLTLGAVFGDNDAAVTLAGASNSNPPAPGCASFSGNDVWYSVTVPASGSLTVETNNDGSGNFDTGLAVYSGNCAGLTIVECDDDDSADGNYSLVSVTGRTPGEVLYVNTWRYGGGAAINYLISAYDASMSSGSFDLSSFKAYPNPVKDMLNVSYISEISSVEIFNMLGQKVTAKALNATQGQIDMSGLSSGTYIVKVTSQEGTKSIKVVKQ
ncbi:T9SS type A sorting domain-containing protein [Flavobacterium pedocola]